MLRMHIAVLLLPCGWSSAGSSTQTTWSGGQGQTGPVPDWTDCYASSESISIVIPGQIALSSFLTDSPFETVVSSPFSMTHVNSCADFDSDGDMDIVAAAFMGNDIRCFENTDGAGTSWQIHPLPAVYRPVFTGVCDIEGDGDQDVICSSLGPLYWFENTDGLGHYWTKHTIPGPGWNRSVWPMDVDLDGDNDILTTYEYSISVHASLVENLDGQGDQWTEIPIFVWHDYVQGELSASDIDADGDQDIAVAMYGIDPPFYPGQVVWCENIDGIGTTWAEHMVESGFERAASAFTCDLDDDGDGDIGALSGSDNILCWWENLDGSGLSWQAREVGLPSDPVGAVTVDLDGDGDEDVACTSKEGSIIYENSDGVGISWHEHPLGDLESSRLSYGDVNSDGCLDLCISYSDPVDKLSWWDVSGFTENGVLVSSILDTACDPQWASLDWTCVEPVGADLSLLYRTSDDPGDMSEWSVPLTEPGLLSGLLDRYFQYMVVLSSADDSASPLLLDITLSWDPTGLAEETSTSSPTLSVYPNPFGSDVDISYILFESTDILITIYDVSGRLVEHMWIGSSPAGAHILTWYPESSTPAGCYLFVIDCAGERLVRRAIRL